MVSDPYSVLELPAEADDETIRRKYLELVRRYPPEQNPERFAAVRAAYEALKDVNTRVRHRLFERGRKETIDTLIEELACRSPRRRVPLETLLQTVLGRR
ncbi:MAG TPA: J domain-containing protein [Gemmataceae bacterium]|nr:J domain-containing protein [Gemmataceae bacterium]